MYGQFHRDDEMANKISCFGPQSFNDENIRVHVHGKSLKILFENVQKRRHKFMAVQYLQYFLSVGREFHRIVADFFIISFRERSGSMNEFSILATLCRFISKLFLLLFLSSFSSSFCAETSKWHGSFGDDEFERLFERSVQFIDKIMVEILISGVSLHQFSENIVRTRFPRIEEHICWAFER